MKLSAGKAYNETASRNPEEQTTDM